jgi:hypothetical protein
MTPTTTNGNGVYDELVKCSLLEAPLPDHHAVAVVSSGVFTHGHVGGEAFAELCRCTEQNGVIVTTLRVDLIDAFGPHIDGLQRGGRWSEIERSDPELLHPERDTTEQIVIAWQVLL